MSSDHTNFLSELARILQLVRDDRGLKAIILTVVGIAYVFGAKDGFVKEATTMIDIIMYMIMGIIALPVLGFSFLKYDMRRRRTRR